MTGLKDCSLLATRAPEPQPAKAARAKTPSVAALEGWSTGSLCRKPLGRRGGAGLLALEEALLHQAVVGLVHVQIEAASSARAPHDALRRGFRPDDLQCLGKPIIGRNLVQSGEVSSTCD